MANPSTVHVEIPPGNGDVVLLAVPREALPTVTDAQDLTVYRSPIPGAPGVLLITFIATPPPEPGEPGGLG